MPILKISALLMILLASVATPASAQAAPGQPAQPSTRLDLLVRDATCAAAARARNAATIAPQETAARRDDVRQIRVLIDQSRQALPQALQDRDLQPAVAAEISHSLDEGARALAAADLTQTADHLQEICARFE